MTLHKITRLINWYSDLKIQHPELYYVHKSSVIGATILIPIITLFVWATAPEPHSLVLVSVAGLITYIFMVPLLIVVLTVSYFAAAGSAGHYGSYDKRT